MRFHMRMARAFSLSVMIVTSAVACIGNDNDEPTIEEAGKQLGSDGVALTKADYIEWESMKIVQAADKDVQCGPDKVKRTFSATANFQSQRNPKASLYQEATIIGNLMHKYGYRHDVNATGSGPHDYTIVMQRKAEPKIILRVYIRIPKPSFQIYAETPCLSAE